MVSPADNDADLAAQLRDIAVEIAREAGTLITEGRPSDLGVSTKSSPTDVVTVMDKKAEALITSRLTEKRPADGILGEEGASRPSSSGIRWIVDPLDGTVNYFYDRPDFAVSIAAQVTDGQGAEAVIAGAVFDARTGRIYEAVLGGGARNDGHPIHCSTKENLDTALIGTGFSYSSTIRARQGRTVAALLPKIANIRRIGSAALDLCSVADGTLDGYFESDLSPWDGAAGGLIAAEAGARVLTLRERHEDGYDEVLVAVAPGIADALVQNISS